MEFIGNWKIAFSFLILTVPILNLSVCIRIFNLTPYTRIVVLYFARAGTVFYRSPSGIPQIFLDLFEISSVFDTSFRISSISLRSFRIPSIFQCVFGFHWCQICFDCHPSLRFMKIDDSAGYAGRPISLAPKSVCFECRWADLKRPPTKCGCKASSTGCLESWICP